jgi:PTH1 family peptidyl-tRNA hydrolase
MTYLFVGLGNPGEKYIKTRHNIGFEVINSLAKNQEINFEKNPKFQAKLSEFKLNESKIILAKPSTFMNNSGEAISKIKNFYKIPNQQIIVIHDDIDLELGKIKIKKQGGAGTHNGLKSTNQNIGNDYIRIRCGIESRGHKSPAEMEISDFVLSKFLESETPFVNKMITEAAQACIFIIKQGLSAAMNKFNSN